MVINNYTNNVIRINKIVVHGVNLCLLHFLIGEILSKSET